MMYFQTFLLDLLQNFFSFFTLELFSITFFNHTHVYQKTYYRWIFLGISLIFSILPSVSSPFILLLNSFAFSFFYLFFISSFRLKESLLFCLKYQLVIGLLQFFASLLCALINSNPYASALGTSSTFFNYQSLTGVMFSYILLNLYINTKRLKNLHIKTLYPATFSVLSTGIILLLLFFNNLLYKYTEIVPLLPWLYVSVIGILVLSLNSYRTIIMILEKEMKEKLLVEKYEMELSYLGNVQDSITALSHLRHDFKNHLIVLESYASQNKITDLQNYIGKINTTLSTTKPISTPNALISSILNAKNAVCQKQHLTFLTNCSFTQIYISDFATITILGNILDNAISAAAKTEHGKISFSLLQADDYLEISCQNNHNGTIIEKNGVFLSTKENAGILHGLGIQTVRDCITSLHGTIKLNYDETLFSAKILLPNLRNH